LHVHNVETNDMEIYGPDLSTVSERPGKPYADGVKDAPGGKIQLYHSWLLELEDKSYRR
jgi:hypothetical protein